MSHCHIVQLSHPHTVGAGPNIGAGVEAIARGRKKQSQGLESPENYLIFDEDKKRPTLIVRIFARPTRVR